MSTADFTLCLIVKDEEEYLEACLEGMAPYAKDVVVVDTGSSDGTVDIARRYTGHVILERFDGNFSRVRNIALAHVHTPWIVFLDADERFEPDMAARLGPELAATADDVLALRVLRYNFFATGGWYSGKEIKIFRNHPGIRYRRAINESVKQSVAELGGQIGELPVLLNHFGHCRPRAVREAKAHRYMALMSAQLVHEPNDAILIGYQGLILRTLGRFDEALDHSRRAVDLAPQAARIHQFHGHVLRSVAGTSRLATPTRARASWTRTTRPTGTCSACRNSRWGTSWTRDGRC
jgi:glycosyltransferase involved in cell wall biosynthesis